MITKRRLKLETENNRRLIDALYEIIKAQQESIESITKLIYNPK